MHPAPTSLVRRVWLPHVLLLLLSSLGAAVLDAADASVQYLSGGREDGVSEAVVVENCALAHTAQLLPLDRDGRVVGEGAVDAQFGQALFNLESALAAVGSGTEQLVKINFYVDSPKTAAGIQKLLVSRFRGPVRPAVSWVTTRLPHPQALLALDAVAAAPAPSVAEVVRRSCPNLAGQPAAGHVALLPLGQAVYVSGQAEKGDLAEATAKTLAGLLRTIRHLGLDPSAVVHLKAFMQPMDQADVVRREVQKTFADGAAPPLTLVEWTADAPIEIELIAFAPPAREPPADTVSFFTPPGLKASPLYSRVARACGGKTVYLSALYARQSGNGQRQVRDVFASLQRVLNSCGSDLNHLVKATYYCTDEESSNMLNAIRPEFYDPQRPPAASKAMVAGVATPERSIALDMIAVTTSPASP